MPSTCAGSPPQWLRRHGFSAQRPDRRSNRQDQAKVDAWLEEEYPQVAARAKEENAVVAWADQCGLRSGTAPPGTSWAPKGQTPIVKVSGRRFRVNIMSAIASRGTLYFTVFTTKFTAKVFTAFLDRLARQTGRKVHVIADRHPVHRSKAVKAWLETNSDRADGTPPSATSHQPRELKRLRREAANSSRRSRS
ncbi:IS630 family transposase [Streptomyces sp. NPDC086023]|uniref:IS630 family transposase n=1 Tax=Streptomyces sp. NPDC086023 TaxID=3365746 RepID=UPI0037D62CC4